MNLRRLKVSDVAGKQLDMPLDHIDAALGTRVSHVARCAVGESRTRVCLAFPFVLDPRHLDAKSFLSVLLGYRANAQADPNPETSLVDESSAVRENG